MPDDLPQWERDLLDGVVPAASATYADASTVDNLLEAVQITGRTQATMQESQSCLSEIIAIHSRRLDAHFADLIFLQRCVTGLVIAIGFLACALVLVAAHG